VTAEAGFIPASRLYDPSERERVHWDWRKGQPLAQSQAAIERALAEQQIDLSDYSSFTIRSLERLSVTPCDRKSVPCRTKTNCIPVDR
jgi:hypothetical protein